MLESIGDGFRRQWVPIARTLGFWRERESVGKELHPLLLLPEPSIVVA